MGASDGHLRQSGESGGAQADKAGQSGGRVCGQHGHAQWKKSTT